MNILNKILLTLIFLSAFSLNAYAQNGNPKTEFGNPKTEFGNPKTEFGNSPPAGSGTFFPNPFKGGDSLIKLLEEVIKNIILPIGSIIAVLAFIYAGFLYATARGNETTIKQAHRALLYAAIGTVLLLGAWAIATAIQSTVNQVIAI